MDDSAKSSKTRGGRRPAKAAGQGGRRVDKPEGPGSSKVHLSAEIEQRIGVHCSMARVNRTKEVNRILLGYLAAHGKGRELFAAAGEGSEAFDPGHAPPTV